ATKAFRRRKPRCCSPRSRTFSSNSTSRSSASRRSASSMIPPSSGSSAALISSTAKRAHPHASPARADLRNYPPKFMATGTADPLVDDNRAFAQKLRAAGGEKVEHFVREGMPHGFYFFPGMFEQGDEAFAAVERFLKQAGAA